MKTLNASLLNTNIITSLFENESNNYFDLDNYSSLSKYKKFQNDDEDYDDEDEDYDNYDDYDNDDEDSDSDDDYDDDDYEDDEDEDYD